MILNIYYSQQLLLNFVLFLQLCNYICALVYFEFLLGLVTGNSNSIYFQLSFVLKYSNIWQYYFQKSEQNPVQINLLSLSVHVGHETQHKDETHQNYSCRVSCCSVIYPNKPLLYFVILSVVIMYPKFPSVLTKYFLQIGFELEFVSFNSYESMEIQKY